MDEDAPKAWWQRLAWLFIIWMASVGALAAVAYIIRAWLKA